MLEGIKKAVLELAYDNGMINREEPEERFLRYVEEKLNKINPDLQKVWSTFLLEMSEQDFLDFVCGDWDPEKYSPEGLDRFLNDVFESC